MAGPTMKSTTRCDDVQLEKLGRSLCEAADRLTDDQILDLADRLHDTLRARRQVRGRMSQRTDQRLHS